MNILVFGIHPDDIEVGCGGTVVLAAQRHHVSLADLADGSASSNGTVEERRAEAEHAAMHMGAAGRLNLGLPDTAIQSEDPGQAAVVVSCIRRFKPDLILAPSDTDAHPDHVAGGKLVRRAIYLAGIHGYRPDEPAHRTPTVLTYQGRAEMTPTIVVDITETYDRKIEAIKAHKTQFVHGRGRKQTPLNNPDFLPFVEARARLYGRQIGVRYGEPFTAASPIAIRDLGTFEARRADK